MITDEMLIAALNEIDPARDDLGMRAALESACALLGEDTHNKADEQQVGRLETCIGELAVALRDMCDLAAEASQYKGEYLAKKHGDAEEIAKARATLARWGIE